MKAMKLGLLIGLVSGCTATKQVTATYWTQKAGIVVVHHVDGTIDHTEKLSDRKLPDSDVQACNLPKGKYFGVTSHDDPFIPAIKTDVSKPKKDADSKDKRLAEVTSELHNLKRQISNLKDQINAKAASQEPEPVQTAQQDTDQPRLSQ